MKSTKFGYWGVVGLFVLFGMLGTIVGGCGSGSSSSGKTTQAEQKQEKAKEYAQVDVGVMMEDLKNNAAAAQKKYKGKDLKVVGKLGNIDSDLNYISVQDANDPYAILGVHCTLNKKDKAQEDYVLALQKDQIVTVYGTITDVGEIMGYKLKVDKFE